MPNFSAILAGTGSCLPERRLTNDDLSRMVETNDEWIVQRTGIRERRIAAPGESTATLGAAAARRAIEAAGLEAKDIDLVVCATITPEMVFPSTACFIGADLGIPGAAAFDLSAACSGFLYATVTGANFIKAGQYRNVLVIGAETLSRITNSAMEKLGMGPEKAYVNIDRYGNTSAASIPIALDEAWRAGMVKPGDVIIFVAFGAGLTWANAVIRV